MLGFKSDELIGKCLYEYHHALDGDLMEKAYKTRKLKCTIKYSDFCEN